MSTEIPGNFTFANGQIYDEKGRRVSPTILRHRAMKAELESGEYEE